MPLGLPQAVLLFAAYGAAGWLLEVLYRSLTQRRLVNPGFLHGPFIPLYAFGAGFVVALDLLLGPAPLLLRALAFGVAVTVLEYAVGALMERALNLRLWDYSDNRLNLHGRVCLGFSLIWTVLALLLARVVHPRLDGWLDAHAGAAADIAAAAFLLVLAVDVAASIAALRVVRAAVARVRAEYLKLSEAEVAAILARFRRLRAAFPNLDRDLLRRVQQTVRRVVDERLAVADLPNGDLEEDYLALVRDILDHPEFLRLKGFFHHDSSIFEHVRRVSYLSYKLCRQLGLDHRSAARGGLLHDFFLYDWRNHDVPDLPKEKFHGLEHPKIALRNAEASFTLNDVERDCIVKHMWPLTLVPPRYRESFVVSLVDKYVASRELLARRGAPT